MISRPPILLALLVLAGCDATLAEREEPDLAEALAGAPSAAAPGTCWSRMITPAVIETVTDQTLEPPAGLPPDDAVTAPGTSKAETRRATVQERKVTWFEIPCADDLTPDFARSVQRALAARDLYDGPVNGKIDTPTRAAIRRFQKPGGLDSGILSIAAARKLGLVAVEMPED